MKGLRQVPVRHNFPQHQQKRGRPRREEEGYFLVVTLVVTTALFVVAGGLALVSSASQRATQNSINRAKALYAAESGLEEILYSLSTGQIGIEELNGELLSGKYRVWLESTPGQCTARTLVAEGTTGGITRRVQIEYKPSVSFPEGMLVAGQGQVCAGDYAVPELPWSKLASVCEKAKASNTFDFYGWPGPTISGAGTKNILVNGDLTLHGTVNVDVAGDVNVCIMGDLSLAPKKGGPLSLNVSPRTRLNFYVYEDVSVGGQGNNDPDDRVDVRSNGWVVTAVQGEMVVWQRSIIDVSPAAGTSGPEGALVFVFSTDGGKKAKSVDLKPSPKLNTPFPMEMGIYAPTRTVKIGPFNKLDGPALFGALVAGQVMPSGEGASSEGVDSGIVKFNDRLLQFVESLAGEVNHVRGSWAEVQG